VKTIPLPQLGFLRGVFLALHLASTDNLARTTKRQNIQKCKINIDKSGPNNNNNAIYIVQIRAQQQMGTKAHTKTNAKRQTEPGLVTFYDIQPGNGAGLFLQPLSLHGAHTCLIASFHSGTSIHIFLE